MIKIRKKQNTIGYGSFWEIKIFGNNIHTKGFYKQLFWNELVEHTITKSKLEQAQREDCK